MNDFLNNAELAKKLEGARVCGVLSAKEGSPLDKDGLGLVLWLETLDDDIVELHSDGTHRVLPLDEEFEERFDFVAINGAGAEAPFDPSKVEKFGVAALRAGRDRGPREP